MKRRLTLWLALSLIFSSLPVTGAGATETATALDTEAVSEIAQEDSSNEGVSVETEATDSAEEDKDETKAVEQVQEGSVNQGITSEENAFEPVESINQDTAFEEDAAEAVTIDEEIAAIVEPVEVTEGKNVKYTSSVEAGWQKINNKWYYFGKYGAMQHGFMTQDGKKYYFGSDGAMVTGWQKINGNWYFFSTGGAMQTDWQKISGRWYYLGSNGVMRTGWLTINNCRYYFQSGGSMVTGWQKIGSNWYYFGPGGAMQTGWQKINNRWYYMSSSGVMQTGKCELGGKEYYFNSTGAWINEDDIMQRVKNVFMKKYSHLGIGLHYPYPGGPISGDTLILCVSRTWAINDPDSGTKWTIAYVNTVTGYVICDYETWQEVFPKVSRTFYIW